MARIRTIKPDFFRSPVVAQLSFAARITFVGLWTYVDDEGRGFDETRLIKADIWPLDDAVKAKQVDAHLEEIEKLGLIERYQSQGRRLLWVVGFSEHQRINRPTPSKLPPAPSELPNGSLSHHGADTDTSLPEGKGRERKGTSSSAPRDNSRRRQPGTEEEEDGADPRVRDAAYVIAKRLLLARTAPTPVLRPTMWVEKTAADVYAQHRTAGVALLERDPLADVDKLADLLEPALAPKSHRTIDRSCECGGTTWLPKDPDDPDAGGVLPCPRCRPGQPQ